MAFDWTCSFCGQIATLEPTIGLQVCRSCAQRIARLISENESASIVEIWSSVAPPLVRREPHAIDPAVIDSDHVFEEFKERVARELSIGDADSHLHLAEAYREMGLYFDARREAAVALNAAVAVKTAEMALRILVTPPLLRPGGLERLRERLHGGVP